MNWYGMGLNDGGYVVMMSGVVLLWIVVIITTVWSVRYVLRARRRSRSPEQRRASRYARGELDEAQYRHELAVLRGENPVDSR
jgi:putative membrane protein